MLARLLFLCFSSKAKNQPQSTFFFKIFFWKDSQGILQSNYWSENNQARGFIAGGGVHLQKRHQDRTLKVLQRVRWSLLKIRFMQNQIGRLIWALSELDNVITHMSLTLSQTILLQNDDIILFSKNKNHNKHSKCLPGISRNG